LTDIPSWTVQAQRGAAMAVDLYGSDTIEPGSLQSKSLATASDAKLCHRKSTHKILLL
jgi:hypothetical protein